MKVGSGGVKKIGRNKIKCQLYANQHRREKNKIKRWRKMIKKLPDNNMRKELEVRIKKTELSMVSISPLRESKAIDLGSIPSISTKYCRN